MKRRDFLKVSALGALTLLSTSGGLLETAAASPQEVRLPRGRKIDMHAHAMFAMLAGMKMMEPVDMEKSMGNLYFDLAGDPMPDALDMLLKITDQEHILYGSDYPYVPAPVLLQKKAALDRELAQREWLEQIYCQNSQKLIS